MYIKSLQLIWILGTRRLCLQVHDHPVGYRDWTGMKGYHCNGTSDALIPAWINSYIHHKEWVEKTNLFQNSNGAEFANG